MRRANINQATRLLKLGLYADFSSHDVSLSLDIMGTSHAHHNLGPDLDCGHRGYRSVHPICSNPASIPLYSSLSLPSTSNSTLLGPSSECEYYCVYRMIDQYSSVLVLGTCLLAHIVRCWRMLACIYEVGGIPYAPRTTFSSLLLVGAKRLYSGRDAPRATLASP